MYSAVLHSSSQAIYKTGNRERNSLPDTLLPIAAISTARIFQTIQRKMKESIQYTPAEKANMLTSFANVSQLRISCIQSKLGWRTLASLRNCARIQFSFCILLLRASFKTWILKTPLILQLKLYQIDDTHSELYKAVQQYQNPVRDRMLYYLAVSTHVGHIAAVWWRPLHFVA